MQKLFDPDGGFSHFITRLSQLIWLNILFLVCSLPVVTFGASSAALYTVLLRLLQGEDGHLTRRFFAAWRDNWKRASGCWLLLLIVIAVCGADLWLAQTGNRFIWKVLAVFALQLVGMVMTFLFPLLARYENTWRRQLSNALMLGVGNLPKLLLMWLYWGAAIVLTAADARHALHVPASVAACGVRRAELRKPQADLADLQPDRGAAAPRKRGAGQEHGRR
ncbi:MAG: DUF624 domain-containing protein [Oscillospiraceae bacterium]